MPGRDAETSWVVNLDLTKNIDSQSLIRAFSFSRDKEKALHGLKGILTGIVADRCLNERELLFLDVWISSQHFLAEDEDVRDILIRVGDILEDGSIKQQELQRLEIRIEEILSSREIDNDGQVAQVEELIGFLSGIASDSLLNEQEVGALSDWLSANESIKEIWPANIIIGRFAKLLANDDKSTAERDDFLVLINQITGTHVDAINGAIEAAADFFADTIDNLNFENSTFCLTGDFVSGDRSVVEKILHERGALTSTSVNSNTDYLLIGAFAARNWMDTSHGRKIEKVLQLKRKGVNVTIITERTLLKFVK